LKMYCDILCEKENLNNIRKFARTVTNKVIRSFRPIYTWNDPVDRCSGFSIS
jgi:hypothetical protein